MVDSHGRRRRRAVDGEQLLALGAAAVAEAGREACTKAGRAKEDGVGRATVVFTANGVVASPPAVADFSALELYKCLAHRVEALARAIIQQRRSRAARGAHEKAEEEHARDDIVDDDDAERLLPVFGDAIEAEDLNDGVAAAALRGMGERLAVELAARKQRVHERDGSESRDDRLHARNGSPAFARRSCEHGSKRFPSPRALF